MFWELMFLKGCKKYCQGIHRKKQCQSVYSVANFSGLNGHTIKSITVFLYICLPKDAEVAKLVDALL